MNGQTRLIDLTVDELRAVLAEYTGRQPEIIQDNSNGEWLYGIQQIADYYHVSKNTAQRWVNGPQLKDKVVRTGKRIMLNTNKIHSK